MFLILCHTNDVSATWVYQQLVKRGFPSIHLLTAEALAYALRWEHRLEADNISVTIDLAQGLTIETSNVQGVLNRLCFVPTEHLATASPKDREYAAQELFSFFLSWLHSLPCPVLNEPTPHGLGGRERRLPEWLWLAAQAGLKTPRYVNAVDQAFRVDGSATGWWARLADGSEGPFQPLTASLCQSSAIELVEPVRGSLHSVLVIGDHVIGSGLPDEVRQGCRRLAVASQTALLGIEFIQASDGELTFWKATPFPDLRGGEPVLEALMETFGLGQGVKA